MRAVLRLPPFSSTSPWAGGGASCLVAFLLLLAGRNVYAQLAPAGDFFNSGAQLYISNNIPSALERVEMGLKTYPDDEKLQKLEKLLKQQQQQQNQPPQNQPNQQQQSQPDQKQPDKKDQQPKPDQQQQDQPKNSESPKPDPEKQSAQKKDEDQKPQQKKDAGDQPKDEKQDQQPGQPVKAGEMTPEEAKRLLDAQKGNEQLLQLKPQDKPRDPSRPVKDW